MASVIPEHPWIAEFEEATLIPESLPATPLRGMNLRLAAGDWVLVRVDADRPRLPLAAAASGLLPPARGRVRYLGRVWNQWEHAKEAALRGGIGRVFEDWGWVSNLSVLENVTLAMRHHTRVAEADLVSRADALAQRFGLPEVPRGRPAVIEEEMLRRAEWVRAWLCQPRLLILERPTRRVADPHVATLLEAVLELLQTGTAVLWISSDPRIEHDPRSAVARRYDVLDGQLVPREAAA